MWSWADGPDWGQMEAWAQEMKKALSIETDGQSPNIRRPKRQSLSVIHVFKRADNGTRTRGLDLGKVALYQLSYVRDAHLRNEKKI